MKYEYIKEQEFVLVNQYDPDLSGKDGRYAIKVELPTIESFFGLPWEDGIKLIDGYGLDPKKQKFDYYRDELKLFTLPDKINALRDKLTIELTKENNGKARQPTVEQMHDAIEDDPAEYEEEIEWIKLQQKRSYQGYWCFIKGRPTYIDGDHYTYLTDTPIDNFFRKKDRLPFYRDIDRRVWLGLKWGQTTTESLFKFKLIGRINGVYHEEFFNRKESAISFARKNMGKYQIEEGDFLIDMGQRTVTGMVWATRRGQGKTKIMGHKGTKIALSRFGGQFAIQALTEDTAKDDVFGIAVKNAFDNASFFYKPSHRKSTNDKIELKPEVEAALDRSIQRHGGRILARSSKNKAFDGNRVAAYGNDESAKKISGDIMFEYNDTVKKMLSLGGNIIGFAMYFSTFGEFEKGGGKQFVELCKHSYNHKRNDFGRTSTGLVTMFNPAYDGYDDYIDEYGESIIEDPAEPFVNMYGKLKRGGAKSFLESERRYKEETGDWIGLNTEIRDNPFTLREAAKPIVRSENVDISIVTTRLGYLEFDDNAKHILPRNVNLGWKDAYYLPNGEFYKGNMFVEKGGLKQLNEVRIFPPPEGKKGKFELTLPPPEERRSLKLFDPYTKQWGPDPLVRHSYVLGCDPFAMDKKDTIGKKLSNGGGLMFWKRDHALDPDDAMMPYWSSNRTVLTYNMRADTTDEYCEDMLIAAVMWGGMVCTERNITHIIKKFREWNCLGYLLHVTDPVTGMLNPYPGISTQGESKQRLFAIVRDYVKYHGSRECHPEVLTQIMETQTLEDMTDNDLFAALGMALMGSESRHIEALEERSNDVMDMSGECLY